MDWLDVLGIIVVVAAALGVYYVITQIRVIRNIKRFMAENRDE